MPIYYLNNKRIYLNNKSLGVQASFSASDTEAPTMPTGLSSASTTATETTLSWTASTDNVGVVDYIIRQNGTQISVVNAPAVTYQVTGLSQDTTYTFEVAARDAAGNQSAFASLNVTTTSAPSGGEVISGLIHRTYAEDFSVGIVDSSEITSTGQFAYTTKGFGNGYQNRNLVECVQDPSGLPAGKWLKSIRPGGLDAHTFSKAIRAVDTEGVIHTTGYDEMWVKFHFYMDSGWATQNQGKLGYSWSNPNGAPPGLNPTPNPEFLFHWFSPNHQKSSGLWPTTSPNAAPYNEQQMVIGLDVYANDSRITNNFSAPIFLVEDADANNMVQKLFDKDLDIILWAHIKLNTLGLSDGKLRGWWSTDGGNTYKKGVDILDMDWRGSNNILLQDNGFVKFYGGSGLGFEPGGGPSLNTGVTLPVQDYHYFIHELRTQSGNPLPAIFTSV